MSKLLAGTILFAGLLGAGSFSCAQAATVTDDGEPVDVTFAGGAAGGTFSAVGEAITEMIRREYPGSSPTYEPGSNAGAILGVAEGRYSMGLGAPIEMAIGFRGEPPFEKAVARDDVRIVARIADGMKAYFIGTKTFMERNGVRTLEDIAQKKLPVRISIGQQGNLSVVSQAEAFLAAHNLSVDEVKSWGGTVYHYPAGQSFDLMRDARADITFTAGWHPEGRILELARSIPITFIPVEQRAVDQVAEKFGVETAVIPKGTYTFLDEDYYTTSIGIYLIAGPKASDQEVYKVAKSLHRRFDYLRGVHKVFSTYEPDMLPESGPYELHPGAAQYYEEAGLLEH